MKFTSLSFLYVALPTFAFAHYDSRYIQKIIDQVIERNQDHNFIRELPNIQKATSDPELFLSLINGSVTNKISMYRVGSANLEYDMGIQKELASAHAVIKPLEFVYHYEASVGDQNNATGKIVGEMYGTEYILTIATSRMNFHSMKVWHRGQLTMKITGPQSLSEDQYQHMKGVAKEAIQNELIRYAQDIYFYPMSRRLSA